VEKQGEKEEESSEAPTPKAYLFGCLDALEEEACQVKEEPARERLLYWVEAARSWKALIRDAPGEE
jgi:hypothetical protein